MTITLVRENVQVSLVPGGTQTAQVVGRGERWVWGASRSLAALPLLEARRGARLVEALALDLVGDDLLLIGPFLEEEAPLAAWTALLEASEELRDRLGRKRLLASVHNGRCRALRLLQQAGFRIEEMRPWQGPAETADGIAAAQEFLLARSAGGD